MVTGCLPNRGKCVVQVSAKIVAVLAAGPALSSILAMVLRADPRLRVREFASLDALALYMRLSPVDLLVCDFDAGAAPADAVARALRGDSRLCQRDFQIVALARQVNAETRRAAVAAGIDEVIVKPMSPRYLLERVLARLRPRVTPFVVSPAYCGPDRRGRLAPRDLAFHPTQRRSDNVVQLFPDR